MAKFIQKCEFIHTNHLNTTTPTCHMVMNRVVYNEIITLYIVLLMSLWKSEFRHQINFVCHCGKYSRRMNVIRSVTASKEFESVSITECEPGRAIFHTPYSDLHSQREAQSALWGKHSLHGVHFRRTASCELDQLFL